MKPMKFFFTFLAALTIILIVITSSNTYFLLYLRVGALEKELNVLSATVRSISKTKNNPNVCFAECKNNDTNQGGVFVPCSKDEQHHRQTCFLMVENVTMEGDDRRRPSLGFTAQDINRCAASTRAGEYLAESPAAISFYTTRSGFDMACYARGDIVCRTVGEAGDWERTILDFLLSVSNLISDEVGTAPNFIDVGGNVGALAFGMASANIATDVFEMMPRNLALLYLTRCANPHFPMRIHATGLSDVVSECAIVSREDNVGDASVQCDEAALNSSIARGYRNRGTVPLRRLFDFYPNGLPYPSVMKLDVEGHELRVMRGALRLLRSTQRPHVIVSEVWKELDVVTFVGLMFATGYFCRPMNSREYLRTTESVVAFHRDMVDIENLVFIRVDFAAGLQLAPDEKYTHIRVKGSN